MRKPERERVIFVQNYISEHGRINRDNVIEAFGVSSLTAHSSIQKYINLGGMIEYDKRKRCYIKRADFVPINIDEAQGPIIYTSVGVSKKDRDIVSKKGKYSHHQVYRAGVEALGLI